jgi:hypothetical protein
MRRLNPVRGISVVALVLGASLSGVAVAGPAGAAGGTVTCNEVTGSRTGPVLLYNCTPLPNPPDGNGGTIAVPVPIFSGTHNGTIDWGPSSNSQELTTVIHVKTTVVKKKKTPCAGTNAPTELKVSGHVRSDTSGVVAVGSKVFGALCQKSNGQFTLMGNTTFTL